MWKEWREVENNLKERRRNAGKNSEWRERHKGEGEMEEIGRESGKRWMGSVEGEGELEGGRKEMKKRRGGKKTRTHYLRGREQNYLRRRRRKRNGLNGGKKGGDATVADNTYKTQ